jgi:hypothetical protein
MERNIISITQTSTRYMRMLPHHCFSFFFLSCFCFPQSRTSAHLNESACIKLFSTFPFVLLGVSYVLINMLCSIHYAFFRLYINL